MAKPSWWCKSVEMFASLSVRCAFWLPSGFSFIFLSSSSALAQWQTGLFYTASHTAEVQSSSTREPVDFTIDTRTVGNWSTISAGMTDFIDVTGKTAGSVTMDMPTDENPIVSVDLLPDDISKAGGGEDVLLLGKKEKIEFSAENTAKAGLVRIVGAFNPTRFDEYSLACDLFPKHAKFDDLVAIYESHKGFPVDMDALEAAGTLAGEIVLDTMTRLRREEEGKF